MIHHRNRVTGVVCFFSDLIATSAAFFTAWYLRFESDLFAGWVGAPRSVPGVSNLDRYLDLLPFALIAFPVVFYFHGLYQVRRDRSRVDEVLTIFLAVVLASLLLSVFTAWYRPSGAARHDGTFEIFTYSRGFLGIFAFVELAFVSTGRVILRPLLRYVRSKRQKNLSILIVGAGALGQETCGKLVAHKELGLRVVGFLDDDPEKVGQSYFDVPVLGPLSEVQAVLQAQGIDQLFIALPLDAHRKMMDILQTLENEYVEIRLVPDVLQYATLKATLEDLDGTPVINLSQVPLQGWNTLIKRLLDIGLALVAGLFLLPIFPLIALAIWLEDHGPVFYRQERMGLDGKPFEILKFRSMKVGAEGATGPVFASRDDDRRTRVGRFLREWSLDELPQLWNVIMGDMSIVGPRPERPAFVHQFKGKIPQYMLRHKVKSGITGWAQVHGLRGSDTSIRQRIEYDLYYIENWSIRLDCKILWMTVRQGLRHNAY